MMRTPWSPAWSSWPGVRSNYHLSEPERRARPTVLVPHQPRRPAERSQVYKLDGSLVLRPHRPAARRARRVAAASLDVNPNRASHLVVR